MYDFYLHCLCLDGFVIYLKFDFACMQYQVVCYTVLKLCLFHIQLENLFWVHILRFAVISYVTLSELEILAALCIRYLVCESLHRCETQLCEHLL